MPDVARSEGGESPPARLAQGRRRDKAREAAEKREWQNSTVADSAEVITIQLIDAEYSATGYYPRNAAFCASSAFSGRAM